MTTPDEARDGEIPPHAPPGGLIGALLVVYVGAAIAIGLPFWLLTR